MTARARKKPLLIMPPLACQVPACPQEYALIGDYADTDRAALLGGWIYRAGQWLCAAHRDHIPWWPGRPLLALPQREPGATRAEFLGVVPRAELPAAAGRALPCECIEGNDPAVASLSVADCPVHGEDLEPLPPPPLPERTPGASLPDWQAAIRDQLSEQALKGEVPLESLAAEPEENEAET